MTQKEHHPLRMIARLGWQPTVVALSTAMEGFIDTLFVAHLGLSAIAAVTITGSILSIHLAIYSAVGFAMRYITSTAKNNAEAWMYIIQGAYQSCLLGLLLSSGTIALTTVLFRLYGVEVTAGGIVYLQVVGGSCMFPALFCVVSHGLQGRKKQKSTTTAKLAMVCIHLVLDYGLIYHPLHLGLIGAACASVLSSMLETGWLLSMFLRQAGTDRKKIRWQVDWKVQKEILNQSFPLMIGKLSNYLGMVYYYASIARTGTESLAAIQISSVIQVVVYQTWMSGVISTISPMVGPVIDKNKQVVTFLRWAVGTVTISTIVSWAIQLTLGKLVVGLFTNDPTVAKMAIWVILLYAWVNGLWAIFTCLGEVLGVKKQTKTLSTMGTLSSVLLVLGLWLASPSLVAISYAEALQYLFLGTAAVAYLSGYYNHEGIDLFAFRVGIQGGANFLRTVLGYKRDGKTQISIQSSPSPQALYTVYPRSSIFKGKEPVLTALQAHRALSCLESAMLGPVKNLPVADAMVTLKEMLTKSLMEIGTRENLQKELEHLTGAHWENRDSIAQEFFTALVQHAKERAAHPLTTRDAVRSQLDLAQSLMPEVDLRMAYEACAKASPLSMVAA